MKVWDGQVLWINKQVLKDFFSFDKTNIYVYITDKENGYAKIRNNKIH
jgi:hypothetical protein